MSLAVYLATYCLHASVPVVACPLSNQSVNTSPAWHTVPALREPNSQEVKGTDLVTGWQMLWEIRKDGP